MLKFKNNGQVVMTEMDDGTIATGNVKLAEALQEQGAEVKLEKGKEDPQ